MEKWKEIALAVKGWMAAQGLTITDVAARLGVTVQAVSSQLSGDRPFGPNNAKRYAAEFGFDEDYLRAGVGSLLPDDQPEKPGPASDISNLIEIIKSQQETIAILVRNGEATKKAGPRFPAKADELIK
jgi:transcriptional regulator with XRE-family HTH domain